VSEPETQTVEKEETAARSGHAPMWKVLFHDDDHTPMDFVTAVLMRFFGHSPEVAHEIMMTVHRRGIGLAGVYPLELAELKQGQVISSARPHYPLRVTIEPS
jgi:ATP-dependent Clp protease adaptor protein ClpS